MLLSPAPDTRQSQTYGSMATAYHGTLLEVLNHGRYAPPITDAYSPASKFGTKERAAIEILGHSFTVTDPLSAIMRIPDWQPRIAYCFGLAAWSLAPSDDATWLSHYHPAATAFSDDGAHLSGAFGRRLLAAHGKLDQIEAVINRIRGDNASRRTAAPVLTPQDNLMQSREYPCCLGVQYFLRDGALHAITYMRAQQALFVLPYDVFLFISIQAYMAARLNVEIGHYHHVSGTIHIYEDERDLAQRIVNSNIEPVRIGRFCDDAVDPRSALTELLNDEQSARNAFHTLDMSTIDKWDMSNAQTFVDQARAVFAALTYTRCHDDAQRNKHLLRLPDDLRSVAEFMS